MNKKGNCIIDSNWISTQETTSTGNEPEYPMKESRHEKDIERLKRMRR